MPNESKEKNKRVVQRVIQAWNQRHESFLPKELISPTLVTHYAGRASGALAFSPAGVVLPFQAFPDQTFTEQMMIADSQSVFVGWEFTGTHLGPLYGRPATGQHVTAFGADFFRLTDGLISEHFDYYSKTRVHVLARLGLLDQTMQSFLINNGLLGRNRVIGRIDPADVAAFLRTPKFGANGGKPAKGKERSSRF